MRLPEVVLKDAAAYIEENGWVAGVAVGGAVCALNAIMRVTQGQPPEAHAAVDLLRERIGEGPYSPIPNWNDRVGKREVLRVLRGEAPSSGGEK